MTMTWWRLQVQCCTLMIWPKVCMWREASHPPSHPGQPTLSHTDCRLDAMPLLSHECWAGGCPPTVRLRPRRDQWLWPGDGRGLGTNTGRHHSPVCVFFMWLTQWTHLAQPPDDTPTLWQCQCVFITILWSVALPHLKYAKKKYNLPKKIALTKRKRCYKFNLQYSGIKIVWVISVLKKVLTTESSAGMPHGLPSAWEPPGMQGWCCQKCVGSFPSYEFPVFSQVNRSQRETPKQTKSVSLLVS